MPSDNKMDPRALKLIFRENAPSKLKAQRLEKKIDKVWNADVTKDAVCRLFHKKEGYQVWAYRIFAASVLLGDYDWWGWECRSGWAWKLCNKDWFYPRWDGKPCKLLVVGEQGLGDEILFISCARELAKDAGDVWWEVDDRLLPMLRKSIPEVNWITRWKNDLREPMQIADHRGQYDAFIPAGNVPKLYRRHEKDFPGTPYLLPVETCDPIPQAGFIDRAGAVMEKKAPLTGDIDLHHHASFYRERTFDEYVAGLMALEEINVVPSAVVHLCGALGKPVNVVKPDRVLGQHNTILKWYYRNPMDWYNCVTQYESINAFNRRTRPVAAGRRTGCDHRPVPGMQAQAV